MKRALILFIGFLVASALFFTLTDPSTLPVGILMVPILLIFGLVATFMYLVMKLWLGKNGGYKLIRSTAILAGLAASLIVLFQSTGGIVLADVILMVFMLIVVYLYIHKY